MRLIYPLVPPSIKNFLQICSTVEQRVSDSFDLGLASDWQGPRHCHTNVVCAAWGFWVMSFCSLYSLPVVTAQGGGGSFKNRKPIGEVGCCESRMAERSHWLHLFLELSLWVFIYLYDCPSTYVSICLSVCLFIDLSIDLSICLSVYLSICLSVYLSTYLSIYLSIYLLIYLSICLSIDRSIYLSIYLSLSSVYLSSYLSLPFICLSV